MVYIVRHVVVHPNTHDRLMARKKQHGLRSIDQLVNLLLDIEEA